MKTWKLCTALGLCLATLVPTVRAEEAVNALPGGNFETLDEAGNPEGWGKLGEGKTIEKDEDGNHFLRFVNDNPNATVLVETRVALNPAWQFISMSANIRGVIKAKGKEGWFAPRITFTFQNDKKEKVGDWPNVIMLEANSPEWLTVTRIYAVPEGATSISLTPGLWGTAGRFDLDDLIIQPVTGAPA